MNRKLMLACVAAGLMAVWPATAQQAEQKELSKEQMQTRSELVTKYDANKDGVIDTEEQGKMSKEDSAKWAQVSGGKKEEKPEKAK